MLKNINPLSHVFLFLSLWLLSGTAGFAQQFIFNLRNGDKISGDILTETTNQITISNVWLKTFTLPLSEIKSRETISSLVAKINAPTPPAATNAPVVTATNAPATNVAVVAKAPVPAVIPVTPPVKPKAPSAWHGDLQVGTDVGLSSTERQLYYGRFKITYAPLPDPAHPGSTRLIERFRNIFDYNGSYGTTDGILSANRMDGSSKTDFDLGHNRRYFAYNLIGAGYDEISKINFRYEVGPGMGYHVFARTNFVLNAEIGYNYQVQFLDGQDKTERYYYRVAEDFTWKISKTLTLDEKFEFFPKVDFQEYRARFESNLHYWILANLSFNLTILDIYDTQPPNGITRNDLQIRSSVGVKF
ncbi:MAG: DUF481 domain-containing protein [Verrucomicrobiota bacterium]